MANVMDKVLTPTDVDHRLSFETESLSYFDFDGAPYIDFEVVDLYDDTTHCLRLYTRAQGHPRPVISKGWRGYVTSKKLRVGDKIIIRQNYDGRAPFSIQAQRADHIVCGEPFWINI